MALSDAEAQRLLADVDNLRHYLFGNGKEGLDEMVRRNTVAITTIQTAAVRTDAKLDALKGSIDSLVQERRDADNQRLGQVRLFNNVRIALIVLSIVIGIVVPLGQWRISNQWAEVSQQLNRLPPLPE